MTDQERADLPMAINTGPSINLLDFIQVCCLTLEIFKECVASAKIIKLQWFNDWHCYSFLFVFALVLCVLLYTNPLKPLVHIDNTVWNCVFCYVIICQVSSPLEMGYLENFRSERKHILFLDSDENPGNDGKGPIRFRSRLTLTENMIKSGEQTVTYQVETSPDENLDHCYC